ncbi:MAG: hypothetical protein M3405_09395 [Acidobacteriota bacterium]|nr:hypothetical protein [Acidobacteriota bacterium]
MFAVKTSENIFNSDVETQTIIFASVNITAADVADDKSGFRTTVCLKE